MKYIKNIEPVQLSNLNDIVFKKESGEPMTIDVGSFILQRLADKKFGGTVDALISASQIKKAVDEFKNESHIQLETKDYELLAQCVKEPSPDSPYNTNIAHCLVPIIQAVLSAKDSKD